MADRRTELMDAARSYSGIPYRLDPPPDGVNSIDCSLLVVLAAEDAGIPLPGGVRTAEQIRQATIPIGWDDVRVADLVFFEHTYEPSEPPGPDGYVASHIGFSYGTGSQRMLDAHERSGGAVADTNIGTNYWQSKLFEARRLPGVEGVDGPDQPTGNIWGPDVASHQKNVDWRAVRAAGAAFGFSKATGGDQYTNEYFGAAWENMKAAGLKRGAYHYAYELTVSQGGTAEQEASRFLNTVRSYGIDTGDMLVLDIEDDGPGDNALWALRWCQAVEQKSGIIPLIYTSAGYAQEHGFARLPDLGRYPLWLAAWPDHMTDPPTWPAAPRPWTTVPFWQYTASAPTPGISTGPADRSLFIGPLDHLKLYGMQGTPDGPEEPEQPPQFQYILGFADLAARLGPDMVGDPLENEHTTSMNGHSINHQLTSRGQMVYWIEANRAEFIEGLTGQR